MARKPNYRYERAERERLKAQRQADRDRRKAEGRGDTADAVPPPEQAPSKLPANPADEISGQHDG